MTTKSVTRLRASVDFLVAELDAAAAEAAAVDNARAAASGGVRNSNNAVGLAKIVRDIIRLKRPDYFKLYTDERNRVLIENPAFREEIRHGINAYFDGTSRLWSDASFNGSIFAGILEEARLQELAAAEEHFCRPGLAYIPQRFPLRFAAASSAVTLVLGWWLGLLTRLITSPTPTP